MLRRKRRLNLLVANDLTGPKLRRPADLNGTDRVELLNGEMKLFLWFVAGSHWKRP